MLVNGSRCGRKIKLRVSKCVEQMEKSGKIEMRSGSFLRVYLSCTRLTNKRLIPQKCCQNLYISLLNGMEVTQGENKKQPNQLNILYEDPFGKALHG